MIKDLINYDGSKVWMSSSEEGEPSDVREGKRMQYALPYQGELEPWALKELEELAKGSPFDYVEETWDQYFAENDPEDIFCRDDMDD